MSRSLVAVAFLTLVAAPAFADHAFTHRYVVTGRLIDAEGEPVSGARVTVEIAPGLARDAPGCASPERDSTAPPNATRTTREGDFLVCLHAHALPSTAVVRTNVSGEIDVRSVDLVKRVTVLHHRLGSASPLKDAGAVQFFAHRVVVTGRVFEETSPTLVEGQPAQGVARSGETVNVTLAFNEDRVLFEDVFSDGFGDYRVEFTADEPVRSGTVTASAIGVNATRDVDTAFRRVDLDVVDPWTAEERAQFARRPSAGERPPGSDASLPSPTALVAAAALAAVAVGVGRRRRAEGCRFARRRGHLREGVAEEAEQRVARVARESGRGVLEVGHRHEARAEASELAARIR